VTGAAPHPSSAAGRLQVDLGCGPLDSACRPANARYPVKGVAAEFGPGSLVSP